MNWKLASTLCCFRVLGGKKENVFKLNIHNDKNDLGMSIQNFEEETL